MSRPATTALRVARDRFKRLDDDARAAVRELLDRLDGTDDAALTRWARDHEDAANLRERWARELVRVATGATAPLWAEVEHQQWRHALDAWEAELAKHPGDEPPWQQLAADHAARWGEIEARFAEYEPRLTGWTDADEWEWAIFAAADDENGVHWAVSLALSYADPDSADPSTPVLSAATRRKVEQRIADDMNARTGERLIDTLRKLSAPWEWLGGWMDSPEADEGPVLDGFEVVSRFSDHGGAWRVIRPAGPPRYLMTFAADLWRARWHGEAVEGRKRAGRELALTTRTAHIAAAVLSPATTVQHHADRIELVGTDGRTVGRMEHEHVSAMLTSWRGPVVDASMVRTNADRLVENARTAAGVAGFWHGLHTATNLSRRGLDLRAEWSSWKEWADEAAALAELKLDPNLRRLLCDFAWYGNTIQLLLFDGRWSRGLWTLTAPDPHKRGRPAAGDARAVAFRYGDVLDPGWARRENPTDRNRGVHLLGLPDRLPVHVADRAMKAPAQLYTLLLLAEVCERSHHEHVADGAEVSAAARRELAARSGLHHDHEPVQLRGLLDDGLLVEVRGGRNRYALGDEKARALRAHTRPTPPHQRGRR
jgi:hypothetical protein